MPRVSHVTKAAAKAAQFASPNALRVIQAILLNLHKPLLELPATMSNASDAPILHQSQLQQAHDAL